MKHFFFLLKHLLYIVFQRLHTFAITKTKHKTQTIRINNYLLLRNCYEGKKETIG